MVIVRSWVGQLALQALWALRVLPVPWALPELQVQPELQGHQELLVAPGRLLPAPLGRQLRPPRCLLHTRGIHAASFP